MNRFFVLVVCCVFPSRALLTQPPVRVSTYGASARPPATWTVDPKPVLAIGGIDGEDKYELAQVAGVLRTRDGRVVVADGGSMELRVFSANGEFERALGRRGTGPGEFDRLRFMYRSGDTAVGHDGQARLQMYTADGTLVRSYARPMFTGHGVNIWHGVMSDGTGVIQGVDPVPQSTAARFTQSGTLGLVRAQATEAKAFTQISVFERVRAPNGYVGEFLGAVSQVAVLGDRVCTGYSKEWEIRCFDQNGTLRTRTVRSIAKRALGKSDIAEYKAEYAEANKHRNRDSLNTILNALRFAEQRASFGRFVTTASGELWVSEFVVRESFVPGRRGAGVPPHPTTWSVLAPDGSWVADVRAPARFALMDAGRDYIAGVQFGDGDVESVVVYRLRRGN